MPETLLCLIGSVILVGSFFLASAIRIVPEFQRLEVYRLGRYIGEKGPGLVLLFPLLDRAKKKQVGIGKIVGSIARAKTNIPLLGTVELNGQMWEAYSIGGASISTGDRIRVIEHDGPILKVKVY